jgi:hypothetical protein
MFLRSFIKSLLTDEHHKLFYTWMLYLLKGAGWNNNKNNHMNVSGATNLGPEILGIEYLMRLEYAALNFKIVSG